MTATTDSLRDFDPTTAAPSELARLARLATAGPQGEYAYAKPNDEDVRPCHYPVSLDAVLRPQLRHAGTWDQARALVQMVACQIAQTGFAGRGKRATDEQREWAVLTDAARRAAEHLEYVPGNCRGCNSLPCRCIA